jgi:hypothetical protein
LILNYLPTIKQEIKIGQKQKSKEILDSYREVAKNNFKRDIEQHKKSNIFGINPETDAGKAS